jgi:hypothetical protein
MGDVYAAHDPKLDVYRVNKENSSGRNGGVTQLGRALGALIGRATFGQKGTKPQSRA